MGLFFPSFFTLGCDNEKKESISKAQILLFEAQKLSIYKKYQEAVKSYKNALKIDPLLPDAHAGLGMIYLNLGKYDLSKAHLEEAMTLCPNCLKARMSMGRFLLAFNEYAVARKHFRVVAELYPECDWAHLFIGKSYLFEGNWEAAEKSYRQILKIVGDSRPVAAKLIGVLILQGRIEEAKHILDRFKRLYPKDIYLKWASGAIALIEGRVNQARIIFEKNLKIGIEDASNSLFLGIAYLLQDRPDDAEKIYTDIIEGSTGKHPAPIEIHSTLMNAKLAKLGIVLVALSREDTVDSVRSLHKIDGLLIGGLPAWKVLLWVISQLPPEDRHCFFNRLNDIVPLLLEGQLKEDISEALEKAMNTRNAL